jgi:hypothetical protein
MLDLQAKEMATSPLFLLKKEKKRRFDEQ